MRAMTQSAAQSPASLSISIVLHHSDLALLNTLLQSLATAVTAAWTAGGLDQVVLTLVDNSCDEGYHGKLQAMVASMQVSPAPQLVASPENPGFGAGHNRVINAVSSDYHLVLNPDVTVRSRGVMEKCSFCIQRIKTARSVAKNEKRAIRDGEITPACVQTCPTNALVFGSLMDRESQVRKLVDDSRAYQALGYVNTKPAVIYLKKVVHEL